MGTLRGEMSEMRDQLHGGLRSDIAEMGTRLRIDMGMMENRLRVDMKAMETRLRTDLGDDMKAMRIEILKEIGAAAQNVIDVVEEHLRGYIKVIDEKYQDLPEQHAELRADFDAHAANRRLHARIPVAATKRLRRPRSR